MLRRRGLLLLGAIVTGVPAVFTQGLTMPRVDVHTDPDVDFSKIETYGWKDPVSPADNHNVHVSIVWYVERELERRGLAKISDDAPANPDVFVRYYAKGRSSIQGTPSQTQSLLPGGPETLTTSFDLRKISDGTLILELQRASDNKALWRAGSEFRVDPKRIDAEVSSAVKLLFRKYPVPPS
jgi:hypothetical protein